MRAIELERKASQWALLTEREREREWGKESTCMGESVL